MRLYSAGAGGLAYATRERERGVESNGERRRRRRRRKEEIRDGKIVDRFQHQSRVSLGAAEGDLRSPTKVDDQNLILCELHSLVASLPSSLPTIQIIMHSNYTTGRIKIFMEQRTKDITKGGRATRKDKGQPKRTKGCDNRQKDGIEKDKG